MHHLYVTGQYKETLWLFYITISASEKEPEGVKVIPN